MLKIFNTLKRKKEIFKTLFFKKVLIYVCGVTLYDICHLGHGRTFIVFDMIVRYLKHIGYNVKYVRNITDIDDKIINKSIENKEQVFSLVNRIFKSLQKDFSNLNILTPDIEPTVTKNINDIIKFIKKLLVLGNAYISNNGDVMFSVSSYEFYGQLSNQTLSNLKKNNNINFYNKRNAEDFVLWKVIRKSLDEIADEKVVFWNSPWGKGRPGWHIECSALSYKYFGKFFDIHGGGLDLLFPHHENERSQSSCMLNKKEHVSYWVHSGILYFNKKKMSKSSNNNYSLKQALLNYDSDTIRHFFLSSCYRKSIFYNENSFMKSRLAMERLYYSILNTKYCDDSIKESTFFENSFIKAMNDDFNTPRAISILFNMSKRINLEKKINIKKADILSTKLIYLGRILGFFYISPNIFFKKYNLKFFLNKISVYKIESLIQIRNLCRYNKNWNKSDIIRKRINFIGIMLEDNNNNTFWKVK
ncbi:cysteine--tRNA ligase [Buchnera aphidicola (Chaitoregma tattakana)]|uniref:cysteine--tRNA ligase n=1 Tax=Buchnera aphidicola TaxID=9 RepID=UPI0031B86302